MTEHTWTAWDLYVTSLQLAKDANDNDVEGISVPFDDAALQSDADRLYEFFKAEKSEETDKRMQVYGMIESGSVEERIEAATFLYLLVNKKASA